MRLMVIFVFLVLAMGSASAQEHPGWSRPELISRIQTLSKGDYFDLDKPDDRSKYFLVVDRAEEADCFVGPGEHIEEIEVRDIGAILLVGDRDTVHTILIYFPVVRVNDRERAFEFYSRFVEQLFPDWDDAANWARESVEISWGRTILGYRDPMISFEDMRARQTVAGAHLVASGEPYDDIQYRITTRAGCEQVSKNSRRKPRRAERNPADRDLVQMIASVNMYYARPTPIDVSSTPIFRGLVWVNRDLNPARLTLASPSPRAGATVDLDAWSDKQIKPPVGQNLWSVLREGWGYQSEFLFLITDPILQIGDPNNPASLLVDLVYANALWSAGHLELHWERATGLLFETESERPRAGRDKHPSTMTVGPDMVWFFDEGYSLPVNVSDTPLYLGSIDQMSDAFGLDIDRPLRSDLDGMILMLRDEQGNVAELDLLSWAGQQVEEIRPSAKPQPITQPVIPFQLGGLNYRFVISDLRYIPGDADFIPLVDGYLFSSR